MHQIHNLENGRHCHYNDHMKMMACGCLRYMHHYWVIYKSEFNDHLDGMYYPYEILFLNTCIAKEYIHLETEQV